MKTQTKHPTRPLGHLAIAAVSCLAALLLGCATSGQTGLKDFNADFGQSVPTNPQYKIEQVGPLRFQIVVYQGGILISERTTRAAFLTQAAFIAMEAHCLKTGSVLGQHNLQDRIDSMGYINVLCFFLCVPTLREQLPPSKKADAEA